MEDKNNRIVHALLRKVPEAELRQYMKKLELDGHHWTPMGEWFRAAGIDVGLMEHCSL